MGKTKKLEGPCAINVSEFSQQVATQGLSKKRKTDAKISFSIPSMKMRDAQLYHLSLGYSSSYKPSLFGCDSSNCFNTNIIIANHMG